MIKREQHENTADSIAELAERERELERRVTRLEQEVRALLARLAEDELELADRVEGG